MRRSPSQSQPTDPARNLRNRAGRLLRKDEPRKALLAMREAAAHEPTGPAFVRLAHLLMRLGKNEEAVAALKQALYCFRYDHQRGRARTVARMILRLDPADETALRRAA